MGEPHTPTLQILVIPLPRCSSPCTAAIAAVSTTLTSKCPWALQNPFCCCWKEQEDALGSPGGAFGVPRAHHARGAINNAGKQVVMLPWLCGRFDSPKKPARLGEGAWRVWSRAHAPAPVLASQGSVSRDGSLPGGQQQQQDEQRRRILLSGCFSKITLPLSAGQGCSRLNNRSRPALPCSRALAGSPSPGCAGWMLEHSPLQSVAVPGA